MFERDIYEEEVEKIINNGTIIENYPTDQPYPSFLVCGFIDKKAIHVVYSKDGNDNIIVITVYKPNLKKWKSGYKIRK
jgi:hypothetical protein